MTPPRVHLVAAPDPTPAQLSSWAWLWTRLLAPADSNAPTAETAEALENGTAADRTVRRIDEHLHVTTPGTRCTAQR